MFIAASAILVVLTGIYVLAPLFREPRGNLEVELLAETELDRLMNRKAVIYRNLKDLELEYKMGRLGEADFRRLEAGYRSEAAEILQELDQLGVDESLDEKIEAAVAGRKSRLFPSSATEPADTQSCPSCGSEIAAGMKFCPDCGHKL
jgi:zinc-ribbon domain